MSTKIIHKKTAVSGRLPTTSQLDLGEIGINTYDGTLHIKKDDGTASIITIGQISTIDDIGDVDLTGIQNNYILKWDSANSKFVAAVDATGTTINSLGDIGDVDLATPPSDGQTIIWDSANSEWIPGTPSTVAAINDLSDVDTQTTAPTTGQALAWNGSTWVPQTLAGGGNTTYAEQTVVSDTYTGNGTNTDFSTSIVPQSEDNVIVSINGVVQDPSTYSLSGDVITLSTAAANGDNVELRTFSGFSTNVQLNNYKAYKYTISSNTTSVTGSDDNSDTLAYTAGKVEVYVNGTRLVNGDDYTATNGTSVTFQQTVFSGSVVEVVSLASAALLNETLNIQSSSVTLSTTSANQVVEVFTGADITTAKFVVQMSHATAGIQSSEVLVIFDGSNTHHTVYGEIYSSAVLGTISTDYNSGNVRLLVTPVNTNTTVKTKRISLEA